MEGASTWGGWGSDDVSEIDGKREMGAVKLDRQRVGVGSGSSAAPNFVPLPCEVVANGVKDACELARCVRSLAACPTEREGGVFAGRLRTHRDSEAASLATRRCYMRLNRAAEGLGLETCDEAAGSPAPGVLRSGCRCWGGNPYNSSCGWRGFASFMPIAERSKAQSGAAGSGSKNLPCLFA